ncbi:MAG: PAS domain S-box protein [Bryobacterales bacterium]|nr:PAS domain S-box protein [Bryobacterales bacterium]
MAESLARAGELARETPVPLPDPQQLLAFLARHLPAVLWTTDDQLRFTACFGQSLFESPGSPTEVVGRTLCDVLGTSDPAFPPVAAHCRALAGESLAFEWSWGTSLFQVHLEPLRGESGAVCGVLGLAVDITALDLAERCRLDSEQRYRSLFENAHDVVFMLDLAGNILAVNRAAERVTGYRRQDLLGRSISDLLEPAAARYLSDRIQRALGGETSAQFELPVRARDGRLVHLDVSARLEFAGGKPAFIHGIARDVTERKRLEEQLREAQKMEAIGALASGVAHEFNNLLTAILGYADLLQSQGAKQDLVREAAEVIRKAAERARQLAARLLGMARRGKTQETAVDLHALLRELAALLSEALPKNIELIERYEAPMACTLGDPGQLHQAFLNLALNARDAMPGGGVLMLRTEVVRLGPETYRDLGVPAPGPYVKVTVTDTGVGIAAEHLPHIFEPFFPTKARSRGTGMGLAMVHGIVKNHGGAVGVKSRPGQGSAFEVYLPLLESAAPGTAPEDGRRKDAGGAILVIDDEAIVGRTAVRLLEKLGYQAMFLTEARQALDLIRRDPTVFGLVLLDMVMPGMGGAQCLRELKSLCPGLPVVVATGYAEEGVMDRMRQEGAAGFLAKPFTLEQLAEAVRRALSR